MRKAVALWLFSSMNLSSKSDHSLENRSLMMHRGVTDSEGEEREQENVCISLSNRTSFRGDYRELVNH